MLPTEVQTEGTLTAVPAFGNGFTITVTVEVAFAQGEVPNTV